MEEVERGELRRWGISLRAFHIHSFTLKPIYYNKEHSLHDFRFQKRDFGRVGQETGILSTHKNRFRYGFAPITVSYFVGVFRTNFVQELQFCQGGKEGVE